MTAESPHLRVHTLAQLSRGGAWRVEVIHRMPHHLFVWFTRGQGRAILHGSQIGFGTHNALFIPANTLFSLELGRQCLGQTIHIPVDGTSSLPATPQHIRVRDGAFQQELSTLIEAMQRELTGARPFMDDALTSYSQLLSVWLHRMVVESRAPTMRESATQRLVRQFCTLVVENHNSGRPMAAYAEELGITPTHLTRVCRQAVGRTAAGILTDCVMYEARVALENSLTPVKDVASGLGFASAAYFTRFIQQHTGQSPSKVRKSALMQA